MGMAAAGYKVVCTARRKDKLDGVVAEIESFGGTASAFRLDVTNEDDFDAAFKFAEEQYGGVDHVFLNAGQTGEFKQIGEMSKKDYAAFDYLLDVNLRGVFVGMDFAVKALRKRGGGSITFVGSSAGGLSRGFSAGPMGNVTLAGPWFMSQGALDQFVRMAAYYQTENIRVYNLKAGVYSSGLITNFINMFAEDADGKFAGSPMENMDDTKIAGFNLFFQGLTGDPKHIGRIVKSIADGTMKFPPGSNINCDNDATIDSSIQYAAADTDELWPTVTVDDLRGYDGGPYEPQEESTRAFIANLNKPEEEQED